MVERKANHLTNKDHKRALASARRAIRKAIAKVESVYAETHETDRENAMILEATNTFLTRGTNLIVAYSENRYGITDETLDRY